VPAFWETGRFCMQRGKRGRSNKRDGLLRGGGSLKTMIRTDEKRPVPTSPIQQRKRKKGKNKKKMFPVKKEVTA